MHEGAKKTLLFYFILVVINKGTKELVNFFCFVIVMHEEAKKKKSSIHNYISSLILGYDLLHGASFWVISCLPHRTCIQYW
jgi:hypothetical protein